jgi:hypothetical protein
MCFSSSSQAGEGIPARGCGARFAADEPERQRPQDCPADHRDDDPFEAIFNRPQINKAI